jgi:TatA/E family protein of Tat protein translocase
MSCVSLAFIDGLGAPEMVLIFVLVLVLFGGQKLPEFARGLGKSIREFKKAAAGVEEEFKRALEEDERKHATPQLTAPAPDPVTATTPVHGEGGPAADAHGDYPDHDHHYDHPVDDVPNDPDHAGTETSPSPTSEPTPEPTILPPAESGDPKAVTPPKPAPPPPTIQYPENPS